MPPILTEGSLLSNRYQVSKVLDASLVRNVYLVQDLHLRGNSWVAKQIAPRSHPGGQASVRKLFENEVRAVGQLEHPSIPRILDYFFKDGSFFLIREYIPGTDLATLLTFQGGNLSEADALRLTLPIVELLGFLIRKNLGPAIFQELSLHSFIVTPQGELRLIDLGLTRLLGNATSLGSVDYAAPEQFSGGTIDARSVVFIAGALLYHVLSGVNPGESPFSVEPLETLVPNTTDATLAVVSKAMQRDPRARYANPEDLVKALKKARSSLEKNKRRRQESSPQDSRTQPLEATSPFFTILLAAMVLIALGAGCYAAYTTFIKGTGG